MLSWRVALMHRFGTCAGITGTIQADEKALDCLDLESGLQWCPLRFTNS